MPLKSDERRTIGEASTAARVRGSRAIARRAPSGSGRTERGHGRPSRISGGATIVSSTCWTMCTQKRRSAYPSTGESIATPRSRAAPRRSTRRDAHAPSRSASDGVQRAHRTAATGQPDEPVPLRSGAISEHVQHEPRDDADRDERRPRERERRHLVRCSGAQGSRCRESRDPHRRTHRPARPRPSRTARLGSGTRLRGRSRASRACRRRRSCRAPSSRGTRDA